jgi:hypothetical protein
MLNVPVISGFASQGLYTSILYFQKRHFAGTPSGFVDPGGPVLAKLELLASRPAPPPPKPGQWDIIKTQSVMKGLRQGLDHDLKLDHSEVVNIIRSTLGDGIVSARELDDLSSIAVVSRSIPTRSRKLLEKFVGQVRGTISGAGPYSLPSWRHLEAANYVCDFIQRQGVTYFPALDRDEVGVGLLMRIANPGILKQGEASLCGPAALLFSVASDNPGHYAGFAIELFEKGNAKIGRLLIEPGKDVRNYSPSPGTIAQVDWMTMASIRDSENWLLDYDTADKEFAGITTPFELHRWFQDAGYSDVRQGTNIVGIDTDTIAHTNELFAKGYRIVLLINAQMLEAKEQTKSSRIPDHWVVLRSQIERSGGKVRLKVFTWGRGDYQIPQGGDLSEDDFLENFYGYVAGRA